MRSRTILRLIPAGLLVLLTGCTSVFFFPDKVHRLRPDDIGLAYEDVSFESIDGTKLHAWFLPASSRPEAATILFLHGNAENISTHIGSVHWLPSAGFNVFLLDYRGYGQSQGSPSVPRVIEDIESALALLATDARLAGDDIIVLGQSIGGALAIPAVAASAHRAKIRAVIIDSAFSSYRTIAREKLGLFWLTSLFRWPLSLFISDAYSAADTIDQIPPIPLLIIHGGADSIVAASHAETLFKKAKEPKELWILEKSEHIQSLAGEPERTRLTEYLAKVRASADKSRAIKK